MRFLLIIGLLLSSLPAAGQDSLADRARQLSKDMTAFLEQREKARAPFKAAQADAPNSRRQEQEFVAHQQATIQLFIEKFKAPCAKIIKEFASIGEDVSLLASACYNYEGSPLALKVAPRELERLATKGASK